MTSIPALTLQANTTQCKIVHRYTGATKNAELQIIYALFKKWLNEGVRTPPDPVWPPWPGFPGAPPTDGTLPPNYPISSPGNPPGESAGPIVPPQQTAPSEPIAGASPTLVQWPAPNRPFSAGTLLEVKHDFESALPAGWTTVTAGNGSLSRVVGTSLTGNGYLRSVKSVAGP